MRIAQASLQEGGGNWPMLIGQLTEGVGKADKPKQAAADIKINGSIGRASHGRPYGYKPLMLMKLIFCRNPPSRWRVPPPFKRRLKSTKKVFLYPGEV